MKKNFISAVLSAAISVSCISVFSVRAEGETNIAAGKTASWNNETVAEFTNGIFNETGKSYNGKSSRAITVDLNGEYTVSEIKVHTGFYNNDNEDNSLSHRVASGYKVKYSTDGATYYDAAAAETTGKDGLSQYSLNTLNAPVAATHIQVIVPATDTAQTKRIREIEIFGGVPIEEVPETENVALNKTAGWNNETVTEFTNGIFNETGKSYNGKSSRAITVDLNGEYTVSEIKVHTGFYNNDNEDNSLSHRVASGYKVKYSTDGATYYDAAAVETTGKDGLSQYSLNTLNAPVAATHIQVIVPATDTAQTKRIREVEIWGVKVKQQEEPTSTPSEISLEPVDISGATHNMFELLSNGKYKSGYTLSVNALSNIIVESSDTIKYLYADTDNVINWNVAAIGTEYTITNDMAGKYICALITKGEVNYVTEPELIGANLNNSAPDLTGISTRSTDDGEYLLYLNANPNPFLLLSSDEDKTLLLTTYPVLTEVMYLNTNQTGVSYQIYDANDPNSIVYKINQTVYMNNNILPEIYHDYIIDTVWETAAGNLETNDTVTKAKLAIPTIDEFLEGGYFDRVGYAFGNGFWFRTRTQNGCFYMITTQGKLNSIGSDKSWPRDRIEFYLDNDIFKQLKVDVKRSGAKALKAISLNDKLTETEAKDIGYTDEEMNLLGFDGISAKNTHVYIDGDDHKLYVEVSGLNYIDTNQTWHAVMGIYDKDDRLKFANLASRTVNKNETITETITFDLPSEELNDDDTLKLFNWESEQLKPLCKESTFIKADIPVCHETTKTQIEYDDGIFSYNGRWEEKEEQGYKLANWVRGYVSFGVVATADTKVMVNFNSNERKYVKVYINDVLKYERQLTADTTLDISPFLTEGVCEIKIMNRSEELQMPFAGITVGSGTKLMKLPSRLNFLFIGDSISARDTSYALQIPLELGADFTTVARSGIAFMDGSFNAIQNDGAPGMFTKFKHMQTLSESNGVVDNVGTDEYDFDLDPQFDAIVVNIGTNDCTLNDSSDSTRMNAFVNCMDELITFLRTQYPQSHIFIVRPIRMQSLVANDEINKTRAYYLWKAYDIIGENIGTEQPMLHFVDTKEWDIKLGGTNGIDTTHPSMWGFVQMKDKLIQQFKNYEIISD